MGPSRSCRSSGVPTGHAPGRDLGRSALVGLFLVVPAWLARLPDELRLHRRRLRQRRQLRLARLVLRLLLRFAVRTIS
ncbi:MAG: hypothetical protein E6I26_12780 [Chloroflexi bacterium]|nr:MAG: hypothetical protein E6I26_12780 [Chloroflexota bacterium]